MIYRETADAEARRQIAMQRRVRIAAAPSEREDR
jgi:hypothetical protein